MSQMKAAAVVQSVFESAVREINTLERRIVHNEDEADAMLWEQARQVVAQLAAGLSQRQLAEQWINVRTGEPYSQKHVSFTKLAFEKFTSHDPRPRFRDAYNEVANAKPPKLTPDSEPFHWMNALEDLRTRVEKLVLTWPSEARPLAPQALRNLATILERECADAGRGDRESTTCASAGQDSAEPPALAS
jgi:hypothetical protein